MLARSAHPVLTGWLIKQTEDASSKRSSRIGGSSSRSRSGSDSGANAECVLNPRDAFQFSIHLALCSI